MKVVIIRRSQLGDDWTAGAHVDPAPMPPPSGDPTPGLPVPPIVVADERWQYEHLATPDEVPSVREAAPLGRPRPQAAPTQRHRLGVPWWSWK